MNKILFVFTMAGCDACSNFKKILEENNVEFVNYDINEHREEHDLFCEKTGNDFVPSFFIYDMVNQTMKLFAPERDFNTPDEGLSLIKENMGDN